MVLINVLAELRYVLICLVKEKKICSSENAFVEKSESSPKKRLSGSIVFIFNVLLNELSWSLLVWKCHKTYFTTYLCVTASNFGFLCFISFEFFKQSRKTLVEFDLLIIIVMCCSRETKMLSSLNWDVIKLLCKKKKKKKKEIC